MNTLLSMSLPPEIIAIKMSRVQKVKGEVLLQFIATFSVFLRSQALSITCLKLLRITFSRVTRVSDKSPVTFGLATVYWPPGQHTDFIKEFADFLSELVLAADKVLIVGNFNIHTDNDKNALGSAFIDNTFQYLLVVEITL